MTRRVFLLTTPLLAKRVDPLWNTQGGRAAIELRKHLRTLGIYDELRENWTEVEQAVREGCMLFIAGVSRVDRRAGVQPYPIGYWWRCVAMRNTHTRWFARS